MAAGLRLVSGLVLFMLVVEPMATTALSCGEVVAQTAGCITYLQKKGGRGPPSGCCDGVKYLNKIARTTGERRTVCRCLETAATGIPGIDYKLAESLPAHCGVKIPFKINPSTNCSRVR